MRGSSLKVGLVPTVASVPGAEALKVGYMSKCEGTNDMLQRETWTTPWARKRSKRQEDVGFLSDDLHVRSAEAPQCRSLHVHSAEAPQCSLASPKGGGVAVRRHCHETSRQQPKKDSGYLLMWSYQISRRRRDCAEA